MGMGAEERFSRRRFLNYTVTAVVAGVVAGVGSYYAGTLAAPAEVTRTIERTTTITAPGPTTTVTTTYTQTVTGAQKPTGKPIVISGSMTLSGPTAELHRRFYEGWKIAVDKINAEGGLLGRPVELRIFDDELNLEKIPEIYERILTEIQPDFLLGPGGTVNAMSAGAVAKRYGRAMFNPLATGEQTTEEASGYKNFMCIASPPDSPYGPHTWAWSPFIKIFEEFEKWAPPGQEKPKVFGIAPITIGYSQIAEGYKPRVKQAGGELAVLEFWPPTEMDFGAIIDKFIVANVEIAAFPGPSVLQATIIRRKMVEKKYNPKFFWIEGAQDADWIDPKRGAGPQLGNYVCSQYPVPKGWRGGDFAYLGKKYAEEYNWPDPDLPPVWAILGYATIEQIREAVKICNSLDEKDICDTLRKYTVITSAGPVQYRGNNNMYFYQRMTQWINGKMECVYPLGDATAKLVYPMPPVS